MSAVLRTQPDLDRTLAQCRRGMAFRLTMTDQTPSPSVEGLHVALTDAIALFEQIGIGYALCGGIAAMLYGRARYTEDVDFIAQPGYETVLARNAQAMRDHRFEPTATYVLYHDTGVRVDLWKDEHVAGMIDRAVAHQWQGHAVRVVEPHDLVAMKLRADRPQDDYDIGELIKSGIVEVDRLAALVDDAQLTRFKAIAKRVMR